MRIAITLEQITPGRLRGRAAATLVPLCAYFLGNDERLKGPADGLARGRYFVGSERFAVSRRRSLLVRCAPADDRPATKQ